MANAMSNGEIYKKTIGFSFRRLGWDILAFLALIVIAGLGYLIGKSTDEYYAPLIGLIVGFSLGGISAWAILHFFAYTYKAGQIAMMTRGVSTGKLPEDVMGEGKKIVKERFTTVAAFYLVTGAIKGIFRQLGNAITVIGKAVGGDTGNTIGSTISSVLQTIVAYLCDCCLGWVFYRSDVSATKATLEGAALFFKHGKTFFKNMGRVFGLGLVSFLIIGGAFFGISYLIMNCFPEAFEAIAETIKNSRSDLPEFFTTATGVIVALSGLVGVCFWSFLHSAFVRPFVLVGVLRNFIASGANDIPSEASFDELDGKSKKFKELHAKLDK